MKDAVKELNRLIEETRARRQHFAYLRQSAPVGSGPRRDHGLEALSCAIRERALQDALHVVMWGKAP